MKKYRLAILFTQPPFGKSTTREGLDALLAATAFCEENEIFIGFIDDGVFNLLKGQQPEYILQKDHISTFKLIDLYDLSECFVCQQSIQARHLAASDLILENFKFCSKGDIFQHLSNAEKILTF